MTDVSMRRMLEAGVHFGHQTRFWNPKMEPFIFGARNKIHIINLEKTLPMYSAAAQFVRRLVADGGKVLFVGSKRAARQAIADEAERCGMPHVSQRWLGGMLTNFKTIRQSVKRLDELDELIAAGAGGSVDFTKKELLKHERERAKLDRALGGIRKMESLPDAVFIIDVGHEEIAVKEAVKLGIPVVAVVDTNCSPIGVDYTIPGNDDAMRAIQLYAEGMADAVLDGKASIPDVPTGDDEFVELDEEGRPKVATAKPKMRARAKTKKTTTKKRVRVTKKVSVKVGAEKAEAAVGEAAAETKTAMTEKEPAAEPEPEAAAQAADSSASADETTGASDAPGTAADDSVAESAGESAAAAPEESAEEAPAEEAPAEEAPAEEAPAEDKKS